MEWNMVASCVENFKIIIKKSLIYLLLFLGKCKNLYKVHPRDQDIMLLI